MKGLLADNDVQGQLALVVKIWQGPEWRFVWEALALTIHAFADVGLAPDAEDTEIWRKCQALDIALLTANRNDDGPLSLTATIRDENTAACLPVFTIGNAKRVLVDKAYAKQVAVKLLEYLLDIEQYRGAGRLYVP